VIASSQEIITGAPFDATGKDSVLLEDFSKKVAALKEVDPQTKDRLLADAKDALQSSVKPAYESLIVELKNKGVPIDFITLTQNLRDRGQLELIGGPAAISHLYTFTPTAANGPKP